MTWATSSDSDIEIHKGELESFGNSSNKGEIDIDSPASLLFSGVLSNYGTIKDAGIISVSVGDGMLYGGGTVELDGGLVQGFPVSGGGTASGVETTLSNGNHIVGSGNIGLGDVSFLTLNNSKAGVVDADVAGATLGIDTGANRISNSGTLEATGGGILSVKSAVANAAGSTIDANGGTVDLLKVISNNSGTVEAENSGSLEEHGNITNQGSGLIEAATNATLKVDGNVTNYGGTVEALSGGALDVLGATYNGAGGHLIADGGTMTLSGAVSGPGEADIKNSGTLEYGAASSEKTVFSNVGGVFSGTLVLDQSTRFSGTIGNFFGDGTQSDTLDLKDINFATATIVSFTENNANTQGVLTITDGTHTAHLTLLGQYSAGNFSLSSETGGGTGTLVTEHPVII